MIHNLVIIGLCGLLGLGLLWLDWHTNLRRKP